jgi:hypothetical protein
MRQWDDGMMRQKDDEITLITNPSHWGVKQCGRGWVDVIVLAVCKCGSDSWFRKFRNNIRPTCAVLNHKSFETKSALTFKIPNGCLPQCRTLVRAWVSGPH